MDACRAYIEATIDTVGRDVFVVEQFGDRFGEDVVNTVINNLKKEKIITESQHEGLNGEQVKTISKRS